MDTVLFSLLVDIVNHDDVQRALYIELNLIT